MRTQSIWLLLATVLLSLSVSAQGVQTNRLNDRQVPHHLLMGTNVSQETHSELLGLPTQHRMQAGFMSPLDSLRASRMRLPFSDGKVIPNGIQRTSPPLRRTASPQSQFYVIDTAIVRASWDTTRHLYSFNASAKRTSDLTQKLRGGLWVDTLRETNTYDAGNNMLSDSYESWSNGQWVRENWRRIYAYDANGRVLTYLYERWSSGQLVDSWRGTYTYDANGRMTSYWPESWSNGQWVNSSRSTYTYDANGNMLSSLYESWSNGQWVNSSRYTYTYGANGNVLSYLGELWSNGQWVNSWRGTYTYNETGKILSTLGEEWLNGQWVNGSRGTYTYDANGNKLSELSEYWSNGQWVNDSRFTYTFDASNNMLSDLYEYWSNGQLVYSWRYTYSYDANGNRLTWLSEYWSNGQWVNDWRGTYTYDANGNMLTQLYENLENGQWVNGSRGTYTYDANGHRLSDLYESWSNGQWVNSELNTYSYDIQGNQTSYWHYSWLNDSWTPMEPGEGRPNLGFSISDSAGNYYSLGRGYNFTLTRRLIVTGVASDIGNVPASYSLSQNYPNPFNPTTTIKYELPKSSVVRLSVFDMLGRQVSVLVNERKNAGVHEVKFDGSSLASGVYFYRLTAGDFVQSKKLLLLK